MPLLNLLLADQKCTPSSWRVRHWSALVGSVRRIHERWEADVPCDSTAPYSRFCLPHPEDIDRLLLVMEKTQKEARHVRHG
jgi:hypothetical protein